MTEQINWYAFRVYHNTAKRFISRLLADGQQYYVAEKVVQSLRFDYSVATERVPCFPSIVFVRTTSEYVDNVKNSTVFQVSPYTYPGKKEPAVIRDSEMETFMFVLNTGCVQMDVVDEKLIKGDRVRVLDGVFKGAEGYIVRIKGDRRFVVSIQGVVAVATSYIPKCFLEKVSE